MNQHVVMSIIVSIGGSWRRGGEEKREERPRDEQREPEAEPEGDKGWRTDKDARRIKNETDDDGWTTVRR